ncbi:LAGLIDADG endonuclease family protein (plasmid) [Clostridium baratii str. Sullivan]|uniref:LAGLIDADG endonuclease family protein n=1 Tax=Clostridium baratii str. Sullivan TaxID=1415775 RepID=A0A0A7G2E9_9CLOT|nr:hypothetical protein [Clostridium baratii]AIY85220.1 LAGLIDADG endonuclease family protein [Clostridium baratii str. Sullivan]
MATKLFEKKYTFNEKFLYTDSNELWYFLGLVAADGYVTEERMELVLNEKDLHILEFFQNIIQPDKPIYHRKSVNAYKIAIDDYKFAKHLKKIFSMESNKKHEELVFPDVPKEYIKDFIRGYIDGDGCITKCSGQRNFPKLGYKKIYRGVELKILGNENFLLEMVNKLQEIYPNKTKSIRKKGKENVYVVNYNFKVAEGILNELYKDSKVHLKRKYERFIYLKNNKVCDVVYSP